MLDNKTLTMYKNTLQSYLDSMENNETYETIKDMIGYAKKQRKDNLDENYKQINKALKGELFDDEVKDLFCNDMSDNECLSIMNAKAAIFDIQQIQVEIKPKYLKLTNNDAYNEELRQNVADLNRVFNDAYLSLPKYSFIVSDAIKYSRGYPMAITLIGWDNNAILGNDTTLKGDITCENVPIENFWWDAACTNIDDCEYCFITKMLPYFRVKEFVSGLYNKRLDLLEAYYKITLNAKNAEFMTKMNDNLIDAQDLANAGAIELLCFYKKENNKVKIYYIIGKKYIIGNQTLDIPYLPFSILKEQSAPNAFTGISSVMLALPLIRQKAYIDSVCNNITTLQKSPTWIVSNQSGINVDELINYRNSAGGKVLTTNDVPANSAILLPSPSINQDLILWRNTIVQDIQRVINTSDIANGINFGSALSGAATQNMIEQATQRENTSITELQKYLIRFTRIVLHFIKQNLLKSKNRTIQFRTRNMIDNKGEDTYNLIVFENGFDWLNEFEEDIEMDVSLLRASKQSKQQQDLLSLYQIQLQYNKGQEGAITMEDIAETLNLPNKQQILNRIKDNSEQQRYQKAIQLVQTVLTLMQTPEMEQMGFEQAVALALSAQTDPQSQMQLQQILQASQQRQIDEQNQIQKGFSQLQGGDNE